MPTNKFHYIWMGRVPTGKYEADFKNGPNELAQQLKEYVMDISKHRTTNAPNPQDQEIIMWVPEDILEAIKEAGYLDPDITLKPIEDLYKHPKHLTQKEKENLRTSVDLLGKYNAYSAQKDILEAAILEEYGGYYFDTTSSVQSIEVLINNQPKDVWFPRISTGPSKDFEGKNVILPDVWAMYNPRPGDRTYKAMLNSYIKRCQFYFPEEFKAIEVDPHTLVNKTGYNEWDIGAGSQIMCEPLHRDNLIGRLVIFSLFEGLKQTRGDLTDELMLELSLYAEERETGKFIQELGVEKFHRGTWRTEAIADQVEARDDEREAREEEREALVSEPEVLEEGRGVLVNKPVALEEERNALVSEPIALEEERDALVTHVDTQKQQTSSPPRDRSHAFRVRWSGFENLKLKYQPLKGDPLKDQIIRDFEEILATITDTKTLDHFVSDFKKSVAYAVLSERQGFTSSFFRKKTDSVIKVNNIITAKQEALESEQDHQPLLNEK